MESFLRVMQGEININESIIAHFLFVWSKQKAVVIKDCE